ncbi:MAG: hypothetical protein ACK5F7_18770, partial [Planctomycetaceae bacterium]
MTSADSQAQPAPSTPPSPGSSPFDSSRADSSRASATPSPVTKSLGTLHSGANGSVLYGATGVGLGLAL